MARQSEFPWLKRWSRAVLAVVLAGLVLAASPALGKSYLVSYMLYGGSANWIEGFVLGNPPDMPWQYTVGAQWWIPLIDQSRGDVPILIDEQNIPFEPGYLVLFKRTFPYSPLPGAETTPPIWQYEEKVPNCVPPGETTAAAEGALTNQYLGSDGLTIKICKINDAGTVKFKIRVDFIQRWILDGPYHKPYCWVGITCHEEMDLFTTENEIILNNLEDMINGGFPIVGSNRLGIFSWSTFLFITGKENINGLSGILTDKKLVYVPRGGTAVFKVKLAAQPASDTVVSVARVAGIPEITVAAGSSLKFTPVNWDTYQAVTLAATADNNNLNGQATIGLNAASLGAEIMAIKKAATPAPILELLLLAD
jgi:hypothetical protein